MGQTNFVHDQRKALFKTLIILTCLFLPEIVFATTLGVGGGVGGKEFEEVYKFIHTAGTGYLGRTIAISAGVLGIMRAAGTGQIMLGLGGVAVALFGVAGPLIVNSLFASAII